MGQILQFPPQLRAVPTEAAEDAVWESGGSLHIRYGSHVRHLDVDTALERRAFWAARAREYGHDPRSPEASLAARRWMALTQALDALENHNRAVGKPSPFADYTADLRTRFELARECQLPLVIITPEGTRRFEGDGW